jgi:hypothetical protein
MAAFRGYPEDWNCDEKPAVTTMRFRVARNPDLASKLPYLIWRLSMVG